MQQNISYIRPYNMEDHQNFERKKKKQPEFQGGPGGALDTLAAPLATFGSLFGASGRPLDDIFHCFSESCFGWFRNGLFDRFGKKIA